MSHHRCINKACADFDKSKVFPKMTYAMRNGQFAPIKKYKCTKCGQELEYVPEKYEGLPSYNKFRGMTLQEKQEMLQKRAHDHYLKKGKEKKREQFKRVMKQARDE